MAELEKTEGGGGKRKVVRVTLTLVDRQLPNAIEEYIKLLSLGDITSASLNQSRITSKLHRDEINKSLRKTVNSDNS